MIKRLQVVGIFLLVLLSFSFFGANFLGKSFTNYATFLSCFIAVIISLPYAFKKYGGFALPVKLIAVSVLISIFMAYISWDQSFMVSIVPTVPLLLWLFFFYLLYIKFPVKIIENIVLAYAIIYLLLYFYQFINYRTILFGVANDEGEFSSGRGIVRIIFPGGGIFFLAVFIALNRLTTQSKGRWFWLFLSIMGIIIPIMQATRQSIAAIVIIYFFHYLKNKHILKKAIVMVLFTVTILYVAQSNIPVIVGLIDAQKETAAQGNAYIRIKSGTYFLSDFSPNSASALLGNGVPAAPTLSSYGKFVTRLYNKEFFMEDVGLIGMYAMFGILAIIGYVIIWVKSFTLPLPNDYYYAKYYLWFLLITSLTSDAVYSHYYLISTVFVLYIYQVTCKGEKQKSVNNLSGYNLSGY